jgi:transcriptional regulator with XRE-family HTH domain
VGVFSHLKEIREYKKLTQKEVAGWFGLSTSSYSAKERGVEGGFGPQEINLFLDKTQIDARWLFGQIDCSIQEADLALHQPKDQYSNLIDKISDLEAKVIPAKDRDKLAHLVTINAPLRDIVDILKDLEGGRLKDVKNCIWGFLYGATPRDEKPEEDAANGGRSTREGTAG